VGLGPVLVKPPDFDDAAFAAHGDELLLHPSLVVLNAPRRLREDL
jgi:hypothetical protein